MKLILFDTTAARNVLFPFTAIRPVADLRCGILTLKERWRLLLHQPVDVLTDAYITDVVTGKTEEHLFIDAALLPDNYIAQAVTQLEMNQGWKKNGRLMAFKTTSKLSFGFTVADVASINFREYGNSVFFLNHAFEIMQMNERMIRFDFDLLTRGKVSCPISSTNSIINPENIFLEEGVEMEYCTLNASNACIYIGKNAFLMEGSLIRGSFAALENSVVKMGSKIYGATTAGKKCTVGGEIKNTVFFDYSNKAHDGYLGDAVIGSWCNLGAGTSASNVKNTAGVVKLWNPLFHQWMDAGNKCGLLMGDYSRTAINTSLNTGTVTGICCNIVSDGFPPKFLNHFTWNVQTGEKYDLQKALHDIDNWKKLKQQGITDAEKQILQYIYSQQS
ncbi:MAG: glucose-1-phosphate thymidylyltransferase [Chitinophagaceae bacterium]|nr:glucose-1-phosphate thymidylyltransferase [Chitinophagaceae bacterium]